MSAPYPPDRPGQAPWPNHGRQDTADDTSPIRPVSPDRPSPIHFHTEPPPSNQNPVLTWVLRGLGLVAIAVLSGLVWWYINNDEPKAAATDPPPAQQVAGEFEFTPHQQVPQPRKDSTCPEHAYGEIQKFLAQTRCEQLTRGLYTTTTKDGRTVYTSVAVVRMASDDDAKKLREKADTDNTGNVKDLVREGAVKVSGLSSLSRGGGYHAVLQDSNVIIVESDFDPASKPTTTPAEPNEPLLDRICKDAIRLGEDIKS